jgi:hypothetical protein
VSPPSPTDTMPDPAGSPPEHADTVPDSGGSPPEPADNSGLEHAQPPELVATEEAPGRSAQEPDLPSADRTPPVRGLDPTSPGQPSLVLSQPAGISDPLNVVTAGSVSASIPSWTPPPAGGGAMNTAEASSQPQPEQPADPVYTAQPGEEPNQAGPYAPYTPAQALSQNGTAIQNGASFTPAVTVPGFTSTRYSHETSSPPPTSLPVSQPAQPGVHAAGHIEAEPSRRRRATKRRLPTQKIFSDLASQAAIPAAAYAIGEDVDGAMCLVRTEEGFEVFNASAGARHEVRVFSDEESAYFYLFGVLVADAVRTGALVPRD